MKIRSARNNLIIVVWLACMSLPLSVSAGGIALLADRLYDVKTNSMIHDAVVLVEGERIVELGKDIKTPPGWRVHDLGDVTLMPGLIDAHSHLLLDFDPAIEDDEENFRRTLVEDGHEGRLIYGRRHAREYLLAGFTTVRDAGNSDLRAGLALAREIADGDTVGPWMISCSRALSAPGGQLGEGLKHLVEREYREVDGPADAKRAVMHAVDEGAACIKLIVDAGRGLSGPEISAAVEAAHAAGVRVTAHVMASSAGKRAVSAGVDSLDHAYFASSELLDMMLVHDVALIPTDLSLNAICELFVRDEICTQVPANFRRMIESEHRRLREADQRGVSIAAGSDMYYRWPGRTRGQAAASVFGAYREAGLSTMSIIRAATIDAARALGIESETGSLDVGKQADIIAIAGDPTSDLESLQAVRFVMRAGTIYRNDTE